MAYYSEWRSVAEFLAKHRAQQHSQKRDGAWVYYLQTSGKFAKIRRHGAGYSVEIHSTCDCD